MCYTIVDGNCWLYKPALGWGLLQQPSLDLCRGEKMAYKNKEEGRRKSRERMAQRRANDPQFVEDRKTYMKEWHKGNIEANKRKNEARKKKYSEDAEYRSRINRENTLKCYKMTPEEYSIKLSEQGGHCALCDNVCGANGFKLHVDHNHECCGYEKRVTCGKCNRGLLCNSCNIRIGYLEVVLKQGTVVPVLGTWLDRAIRYLDSYKGIP
jgi:hypothetical protein